MKRMLGNFLTLIGLLSLTVPCLAQNGEARQVIRLRQGI